METPNNQFNEFNELDDLRRQINDLKNKVDQQGRLNDELVRKTIQKKMKGVHHIILWLSILAIAAIPLYIVMKVEDGFSWPFTIFTILFLLGCVTADYLINHIDVRHMGDDMVGTARKLAQMKKNRSLSQKISISIAVLWLAWFCYEFYQTHLELMSSQSALVGIVSIFVMSALIGGAIGYSLFRKMQRANDEMIDQINELMHE